MTIKYDPDRHHRRSIRLKGYDYSQPGAYFVTICTQNRECLFGEIRDGEMFLNDAGMMIEKWWLELNKKYPTVETDEYVVMPNHFHGIVVITSRENENGAGDATDDVGATLRGRPAGGRDPDRGQPHRVAPTDRPDLDRDPDRGQPRGDSDAALQPDSGQPHRVAPTRPTLGDIMDWFKTMTTNEYIRGVKQRGWQPFDRKLWQRNYYEHIVRNERELNAIREYIRNNPANWSLDRDNIHNTRRLPPPETVDDYLRDVIE